MNQKLLKTLNSRIMVERVIMFTVKLLITWLIIREMLITNIYIHYS